LEKPMDYHNLFLDLEATILASAQDSQRILP
jgi:hypothetical protein